MVETLRQTDEEIEKANELLKQEADELARYYAVIREQCLYSYFDFFVEFWDIISSDELVINWHIKYICDQLQEVAERVIDQEPAIDAIYNVPPGTSKSSMVSVALQPWIWLHKPDCVVIGSSYSKDVSVDHSIKSKLIFKSERYQTLFADHFAIKHGKFIRLIKDNEAYWLNNFGGARIATSTGGSITGKHGHLIIRDDPISQEQAESSAYRLKANRFNDRTLSNRKKDKKTTPTITVMQRLHVDDTTGHDLAKTTKKIKHIKLPAKISEKVRPVPEELAKNYINGYLDPVRLGQEVLDGQREDLGAYGFAGQYDQSPTPGEGGKFKRDWFNIIPRAALPFDPNSPEAQKLFLIDGAFTKDTNNDPSAQMAFWNYKGTLYIDWCNPVRKELPAYLAYMKEWLPRHGYRANSIVRVEMKSSGPGVKAMLATEEYGGFNMGEINSLHVSWGKITRAEFASPSVEAGKVVLVKGSWNQMFIDEVVNFPNDTHDDMLDLLCYAVLQELKPKRAQKSKRKINFGGKLP